MQELQLPIKDKITNLMAKGTFMIFMNGIPNYPTDQNSRLMMEIFRHHYPWVINNPKDPT